MVACAYLASFTFFLLELSAKRAARTGFPAAVFYIFFPLLGLTKSGRHSCLPLQCEDRGTTEAHVDRGTRRHTCRGCRVELDTREKPTHHSLNPLRFPSVANAADSHLPTDHRSFYLDPRRKNERQGLAAPPGRRVAYLSHLDTCEKRSEKGNTHATPVMKCSLSYCHPLFPSRHMSESPRPYPRNYSSPLLKKKKK